MKKKNEWILRLLHERLKYIFKEKSIASFLFKMYLKESLKTKINISISLKRSL